MLQMAGKARVATEQGESKIQRIHQSTPGGDFVFIVVRPSRH